MTDQHSRPDIDALRERCLGMPSNVTMAHDFLDVLAYTRSLEEQYGKLHLAAEAVFRSENKRDGGVYVNAQDMEALGAALNPARRIPDA